MDKRNILIASGLLLVSTLAFSPRVRKEILVRDKWTCTNPECIGIYMGIGALNWGRGWNVQAAHEPNLHQRTEDNNANHGRCRCLACHITEEIQRGNHSGAGFLYDQHTIHNTQWLQEHNWYGENRRDKIPFTFFMQWANANEEQRWELAAQFREKYVLEDSYESLD